jgi:hypothetical protein
VAVHRAFGYAHVLCLLIHRVRVLGDVGSFLVSGRGARVQGNRQMHFPFFGWGVGGRWWQPCPSLAIPHVRLGCRSLNCHMRLLADQYSVASRPISCLVLTLNHVYVWSSAVLCMAIIDIPAPFRNILLIFVLPFILEVGRPPSTYHDLLLYWVLDYYAVMLYCPCPYYRLLHHAFLWENINERYSDTFGWNATTIDPCACG